MLEQEIENLNVAQAADAVKNLRLTFGAQWPDLEDATAYEALRAVSEAADIIRSPAAYGETDSLPNWERWYKASLLLAVALGFESEVKEAIEDATRSGSKDMSLAHPGIFAALLLLLKWRPATVELSKQKVRITWRENDVHFLERILDHLGIGMPR
jgi:hypothetical protein